MWFAFVIFVSFPRRMDTPGEHGLGLVLASSRAPGAQAGRAASGERDPVVAASDPPPSVSLAIPDPGCHTGREHPSASS